jgi:DNA-directed RNA polymerase specialized sigma24 family protein
MTPEESVTQWIFRLQQGDGQAVRPLWDRYFPRLVELARARLGAFPRRVADEEDVALVAFDCFCRAVAAGRLPRLGDRKDLWHVLLLITGQKVIDLIRSEKPPKGRPGLQEFDLEAVASKEPTPEFAAMVAEKFDWLLTCLGNDTLRKVAVWKMEGYTSEEIAGKLGCVCRTVERRLQEIRQIWSEESAG